MNNLPEIVSEGEFIRDADDTPLIVLCCLMHKCSGKNHCCTLFQVRLQGTITNGSFYGPQ